MRHIWTGSLKLWRNWKNGHSLTWIDRDENRIESMGNSSKMGQDDSAISYESSRSIIQMLIRNNTGQVQRTKVSWTKDWHSSVAQPTEGHGWTECIVELNSWVDVNMRQIDTWPQRTTNMNQHLIWISISNWKVLIEHEEQTSVNVDQYQWIQTNIWIKVELE